MKKVKVVKIVYPIEPGFLWLTRIDGFWGGWRNVYPKIEGGKLELACLHRSDSRVMYEFFLYRIPEFPVGTQWKPTIESRDAEHFDLWGLPAERLLHLDKVYLPKILALNLHKDTSILKPLAKMA